MRTSPEQRRLMAEAVKRGIHINLVAKVFDVCINTVKHWCRRDKKAGPKCFKDKLRKAKESKITVKVELAILAMRTMFEWGTGRIQQGLVNLPDYAKKALKNYVEDIHLSRTSINEVLKKHKLNGYKNKTENWKFFRAKKPNELWQLDIKGPFIVQGKKYWFVICVDDYSRYLLIAEQLDHEPTIQEIEAIVEPYIKKYHPENILTDNKPFKESWKNWCIRRGVKALFAHPYYPQDKGKVERAIRNISEEFIYLIKKFPEWLNGKIESYKRWYNNKRYHRGIKTYPILLYYQLES